MRVAGRFHLAYCSNIHAGESWSEVRGALGGALPEIRRQLGVSGPFAIGLRLSAAAANSLGRPETFAEFQSFLRDGDYYVPTINGFPYGAFHGRRVKDKAYLPDWRSPERVSYSNGLASILAALLDGRSDIDGSVSTVPGAFKAHLAGSGDQSAIADGILRHAAHLARLRQRTGVTVTLAIEPEPACFIETIAEAVAFFVARLFDATAIRAAAAAAGAPLGVEDVRRHVGVCLDACHMAVEFEDPAEALGQLREAGIRVCKVQLSSALRVPRPAPGSRQREVLARFAEDTYLHQVVERGGGRLTRYTDLPDALSTTHACDHPGDEWRVHFHVPVFLESMEAFDTTQAYLMALIELLKREPETGCLEVETYTWDVLPQAYRTVDVRTAIARELAWVRGRLES